MIVVVNWSFQTQAEWEEGSTEIILAGLQARRSDHHLIVVKDFSSSTCIRFMRVGFFCCKVLMMGTAIGEGPEDFGTSGVSLPYHRDLLCVYRAQVSASHFEVIGFYIIELYKFV